MLTEAEFDDLRRCVQLAEGDFVKAARADPALAGRVLNALIAERGMGPQPSWRLAELPVEDRPNDGIPEQAPTGG